MRILAINYEFPPVGGGGGNANYYLAREMVERGHEVTVVTSHFRGLERSETVDGIHVKRVRLWRQRKDFTKFHGMLQYVLFSVPGLARLCRRENFDVVQTFFAVPSGPVGVLAGRLAMAPVVVRLGGGDLPGHEPKRFGTMHRLLRPVIRRVLTHAAHRVVNSTGLQKRAVAAYPGLSFRVIPNGVDLEEFHPDGETGNDIPVILCVARLIERKGLQFLLPALRSIASRGIDFRLQVAGDGPMRPKLEDMAGELGLADRVDFLGLVPHDRVAAIYRRADLFVLPSLSEGMPNVVLEAIASGLPVVGTDVPGMSELVRHGRSGYVVPAGEPEALVEPMEALLCDLELRRRFGTAGRQRARRYSWRRLAQEYLMLYSEVA